VGYFVLKFVPIVTQNQTYSTVFVKVVMLAAHSLAKSRELISVVVVEVVVSIPLTAQF